MGLDVPLWYFCPAFGLTSNGTLISPLTVRRALYASVPARGRAGTSELRSLCIFTNVLFIELCLARQANMCTHEVMGRMHAVL